MTWRDVFDSYKYAGHPNSITYINEFLWEYTTYRFFAFNGIIYTVTNPNQFDMEKSDTGLTVDKL